MPRTLKKKSSIVDIMQLIKNRNNINQKRARFRSLLNNQMNLEQKTFASPEVLPLPRKSSRPKAESTPTTSKNARRRQFKRKRVIKKKSDHSVSSIESGSNLGELLRSIASQEYLQEYKKKTPVELKPNMLLKNYDRVVNTLANRGSDKIYERFESIHKNRQKNMNKNINSRTRAEKNKFNTHQCPLCLGTDIAVAVSSKSFKRKRSHETDESCWDDNSNTEDDDSEEELQTKKLRSG